MNHEGLAIGELDIDVFLLDAGEFAVELILVGGFFDVEFWTECGEYVVVVVRGVVGRAGCGSLVELIEVAEESKERLEGGRVDASGWTETAG